MSSKEIMSPLTLLRSYDILPDIDMRNENFPPIIIRRIRRSHTQRPQLLIAIGPNHTRNPKAPSIGIIRGEIKSFLQQTQGKDCIFLYEGGIRILSPDATEYTVIRDHHEPGLVALSARQHHIESDSPEPPDFIESEDLLSQGFTREVIMYNYIARLIPQWLDFSPEYREEKPFEVFIERFFSQYKVKLTRLEQSRKEGDSKPKWTEFDFSFDSFVSSHNQLFPDRSFDLEDKQFFLEQTSKFNRTETEVQRVARECNRLRDKYIAKEVLRHWRQGKSIFIVYGWPHVFILADLLETLGLKN